MHKQSSLKPQNLSLPTILGKSDDTSSFSCGNKDIDEFIQKEALIFQEQCLGVTYVFKRATELIGFATLCMGNLNKHEIATKDRLPKHIGSYPALLIGQLAVCNDHQSNGIGTYICDFCLDRAVKLTHILGCRFLVVDAVTKAVKFYVNYGFVLAPKQEKEKQQLMFLDITKRKNTAN
jgi:predicted GNAT family N-acyltransferase